MEGEEVEMDKFCYAVTCGMGTREPTLIGVYTSRRRALSYINAMQTVTCWECNGSGKIPGAFVCDICHGSGVIKKNGPFVVLKCPLNDDRVPTGIEGYYQRIVTKVVSREDCKGGSDEG